ncbi:nuclear transport factor 2 family protein [Rhizorhabdus dicambivorans]|nr:nuclear transport factor 2 family protein [Rhizorhabdus dicambivorans]
MRRVAIGLAGIILTAVATAAHASYADDRAEIENLSARYFIAFDALDPKTYADTFTPDGVLIYGGGTATGRQAIYDVIAKSKFGRAKKVPADTTSRPRAQHNIVNEVIEVSGNTATQKAYWFAMTNDTPDGTVKLLYMGHYQDELVKVKGRWLFKKRQIWNESLARVRSLFYPELGETDPREK